MNPWLATWRMLPLLLLAAVTTIKVTAGGFALAVVLGLLGGVLDSLPSQALRIAVRVYVDVFRAVPILTQLFIIYFGLTNIGIRLDPIPAAIIGFGLNGGAILTEVFRAGIESVHIGQLEAAQMIGMRRWAVLRIVVLPQAMRVSLPPLGNFAIGLLKDTALASAVAAPELMFRARNLVDKTFLSTQIYIAVSLIYLAMSLPLSFVTRQAEALLARGRQ